MQSPYALYVVVILDWWKNEMPVNLSSVILKFLMYRLTGMDTNVFGLGARTAIHVIFTLWE